MPRTWIVGSSEECDLVIDAPGVSGRHCRLTRDADGRFTIEDVNSLNGTFVNGAKIDRPRQVDPGDAITLGILTPLRWPADAIETPTVLTLGRDPENDVVIDLPIVSGRHAKLLWDPQTGEAWVEDLGSSNGTSIGAPGLRTPRARLQPSDTLYLGSQPIAGPWLYKRLGLPAVLEVRRSATLIEPNSSFAAPPTLPDQPVPLPVVLTEPPPPPNPKILVTVRHRPALALLGQSALVGLAVAGLLTTMPGAAATAFALSLCALWFGLLTAIFDGVLRPSWIGVDRPMSTAEIWLATTIASVSQSLITLLIVKQIVGVSGPVLPEIGLLALAACAGLALGKLIVALFRRSDFILGAAILTFAALILFAKGPLVPAIISEATPSRWAYEGLLLIEIAPQFPAHGEPRLPGLSRLHGVSACSLALGLMLVGFGGAAIFLNRENPPASPHTAAF
jgi:pSer/pThr/pTyr-binding forkhead associated (FHA) protein